MSFLISSWTSHFLHQKSSNSCFLAFHYNRLWCYINERHEWQSRRNVLSGKILYFTPVFDFLHNSSALFSLTWLLSKIMYLVGRELLLRYFRNTLQQHLVESQALLRVITRKSVDAVISSECSRLSFNWDEKASLLNPSLDVLSMATSLCPWLYIWTVFTFTPL